MLARFLHLRSFSPLRYGRFSAVSLSVVTLRPLQIYSPKRMCATTWVPNKYPSARRSDHVDVYDSAAKGEVHVPDPYHWLEESSDETNEWIDAQESYTREYLDKNPDREKLEIEIRNNTNYEKFSAPILKDDGRWYWYYNEGLQSHSVMYRSMDDKLPDFSTPLGPGGEVFFDPNLLSEDGSASLSTASFSKCGKYFAYGVSRSGSDFFTIYVRLTSEPFRVANGRLPDHNEKRLDEEIRFVKFSGITWTPDSKGFFYQRFPDRESHGSATEDKAGTETNKDLDAMLYYHRINTPQSEDVLIHKDPEHPEWMFSVETTEDDGRYLILYAFKDTSRKNLLWIADLETNEIGPNINWDKLIDEYDSEYDVIANDDTDFYFRTNKDAPRYKIVKFDLADPSRTFHDFIPEDPDAHLEDITPVNKSNFVVIYKRNVRDEIYIYSDQGSRLARLASGFVGSASVAGRRKQSWFFVVMSGFDTPGTIARYDFEKDEERRWSVYRITEVNGLNPEEFESKQVWYTSKDGTKVPMFVTRHKSTKFDGTAPCIQYGYGGFSVSISPFFSPSMMSFLKKYNAVLAVPNIRGGSEFGEDWHLAGTRERKVNVFDDFIAATQYLVSEKIVAPGKTAINGGSNGGLLVAACVNRAPEGTFGAAVAEVGVLDLLKFADFTVGKAWVSDYGDPHVPEDFDFIHPISPLHNVPIDRVLPPTLLLTADHDDRVVPLHSFKHAATLQHTLPHNSHPLLIRIDKKSGHGAGKSTEKRIKEAADKWGFVAQAMGLKWNDRE